MKQPNNTAARVRTLLRAKEHNGNVRVIVRDRNGNIVDDKTQKMDSLVKNYWGAMYSFHKEENTRSMPSLTGAAANLDVRNRTADAGLEDYGGIMAGTGSSAVTYDDTTLTLIAHGVGTGELSAEATSVFFNDTTNEAEIVRTFVNADTNASSITVREVGVGTFASTTGAVTQASVNLYIRDVLDSELVIPFEGVLTVIYTIKTNNGNDNYARLMTRCFTLDRSNQSSTSYYNTTGSLIQGAVASEDYGFLAILGDSNNGLVVGSVNTNPTTNSTYNLEGRIGHGTGAGELFYYESTISSFEENSATNSCRWYLNRVVQNQSGGTVTVREVGLYSNVTIASTNTVVMFDRKFPDEGAVTIADGQFATFSWEFCYIL